ncbi:MAG: helix-turn-helix transcriptional regulator [Pseudomonadota bacterium]
MVVNDWPAMMRRKTAAAYLDLSIAAFEREVLSGTIPQPVMLGGREAWSRKQVDAAMDALTGGMRSSDWREHSPLYRK